MYLALAAASFAFAFSEAPNAATVTEWFMLPEPKSLPGTTTISFLLVFLFNPLKLTETRWLLVLDKYSKSNNGDDNNDKEDKEKVKSDNKKSNDYVQVSSTCKAYLYFH